MKMIEKRYDLNEDHLDTLTADMGRLFEEGFLIHCHGTEDGEYKVVFIKHGEEDNG